MKMRSKIIGVCAWTLWASVTAQAAEPTITDIAMVPRLAVTSDLGVTNQIQYTSDLSQTNWITLTNVVARQSPYWVVDVNAPPAPARFYRVVALAASNPPGMELVPAGSFAMGDALGEGDGDELVVHTVNLSAFYMDRYHVTQALWDEVYQWAIANGYAFENGAVAKAAEHPVHSVSWYDAVKWCNARSEKELRTPAYYTDVGRTQPYRSGQLVPYVLWSAGYRLPTEAEWEKAARGGTSGTRFPWGNTISHSQANYFSPGTNSYDVSPTRDYHPDFAVGAKPYTSPVSNFPPNGYGLYDMVGNVWSWCWDWYDGGYYSVSPATDPRGPATGSARLRRGGSWTTFTFRCRVSYRQSDSPSNAQNYIGFRTVLPAGQ
jgi:sulfatase modifying factor 1